MLTHRVNRDDSNLRPIQTFALLSITSCLFIILTTLISVEVTAFKCYICDSKNDIECVENVPDDSRLVPKDCGNLTNAKYCVKTTNVYAGELGTKRFCASNDQGSYCKYVRQPTGDREYRSCVLTCDSEACNAAKSILDQTGLFYLTLPLMILTILVHLKVANGT